VTIEGQKVSPGNPCQYCDKGCTRHDDQPEDICRDFECSWVLDENMPDEWRPDKIGAIVIPAVYQWNGNQVDGLTPVDRMILPEKSQAIMKYLQDKKRLLILNKRLSDNTRLEFPVGPPLFQKTFA
jgi:hypothetical protein